MDDRLVTPAERPPLTVHNRALMIGGVKVHGEDERVRARKLGQMLRQLRGPVDQAEAGRRANSRQWWIDNERGLRIPNETHLARAVIAFRGDIKRFFEVAGYDPAPYLSAVSEQDNAGGEPATRADVERILEVISDQRRELVEELTKVVRAQVEIERILDERLDQPAKPHSDRLTRATPRAPKPVRRERQ